jgi:hypothetical protein
VAVEENEVDGMGFAFSAWDFSQCPQQPQQRSGGESGAKAFEAIEDEGDDMGFAFSAWGVSIPEIKEEDVMEEVDLRQFWGPEYRWEDSVPGMTEHEVVIEEVAMTAGVGRTEEREVSMRWALDSGASKHIASDIRSFVLPPFLQDFWPASAPLTSYSILRLPKLPQVHFFHHVFLLNFCVPCWKCEPHVVPLIFNRNERPRPPSLTFPLLLGLLGAPVLEVSELVASEALDVGLQHSVPACYCSPSSSPHS